MPLYMDVHNIEDGVTCDAVRDAHAKDVEIQDDHRVHRESHGLVADEIYEVQEGT